jgi:hypothetical protein
MKNDHHARALARSRAQKLHNAQLMERVECRNLARSTPTMAASSNGWPGSMLSRMAARPRSLGKPPRPAKLDQRRYRQRSIPTPNAIRAEAVVLIRRFVPFVAGAIMAGSSRGSNDRPSAVSNPKQLTQRIVDLDPSDPWESGYPLCGLSARRGFVVSPCRGGAAPPTSRINQCPFRRMKVAALDTLGSLDRR